MPGSSHRIRVVLIETIKPLSIKVENILLGKSALRMFDTVSVPNLKRAFQKIDEDTLDMVLMEINPIEDPEFTHLSRLRKHAPHVPVVALLAGNHQPEALKVLQAGAHRYILENQISEETLPAFLLRTFERAVAQNAIRESEERFRLMIENASDVILMLDKGGVITFAGPSTKRILGVDPIDLLHKNALDYLHRDDRRPFLDSFEKAFETGELGFIQFRFRLPGVTGAASEWLHMEGKGRVVRNPDGVRVCVLNSHDVSHRVKLEEELRSLSLRDELTGLHNRRSFVTTFETQLKIVRRTNKKGFHLLFIDLDGFKGINDTLGHKEGDKALVQAAAILKNTFRDADVIARLGGDEFVVFLTDGENGIQIDIVKKRLTEGVDKWNQAEERSYRLAMSVGVVHHDFKKNRSAEDILREADDLMYKHKRDKKRGGTSPVPK